MSAASMKQTVVDFSFPIIIENSTQQPTPPTVLDSLIVAAGIRPDDRVLVIGRGLPDHLVALARYGCRSAAGADPRLYLCRDEADVLWFSSIEDFDTKFVTLALSRVRGVRRIVIDFAKATFLSSLWPAFRHLLDRGFIQQSRRHVAGHLLITALVPRGTTGEASTLPYGEQLRLVQIAAGRTPVITVEIKATAGIPSLDVGASSPPVNIRPRDRERLT